MESKFDEFVRRWPNKRPPHEELIQLAKKLCDEAQFPITEGTSEQVSAYDSEEKLDDDPTTCRVTWDGVSPKWFTDVFMKTPEVQQHHLVDISWFFHQVGSCVVQGWCSCAECLLWL